MKSHFIDIDIILHTESKPWIVSKENPNIPILKIEPSDFKLFQSGIYRNQNNKLEFNGKTFYLSNEFMNIVKLAAKKYKADVSNLAISMQEYLNKELVENIPFTLDMSIFNPIINQDDDIYIICSKNTKKNYEKQILKLEEKLKELGLQIKNYYFISETFFNRNEDDIAHLKLKLILQHLIGLKTESDKITNQEITDYTQITFYDDSKPAIKLAKRINHVLESLLIKTDKEVKLKVKDKIQNVDNILVVKEYTHNKSKRFNETIVELEYSNVIKNFENFQFKKLIKENFNSDSIEIGKKYSESDIYPFIQKLHRNEEDFYEGDISERIERFPEYVVAEIPVDKINMDEYEIDEDYVKQYIKKFKETRSYPPIVLGYYDNRWGYDIIDGNHRANALRKAGVDKIVAFVGINQFQKKVF